jgi:[citrate (pro-3S)-lyase] ligase
VNYQFKNVLLANEIEDVKSLLAKNDLFFESKVSDIIGLYDEDKLIATGSLDCNVIKMLAVDPNYQGEQLLNTVLSHLIHLLHMKKIYKYFIFTKPHNKKFFLDYNLFVIEENENIILFENKIDTIVEQLNEMKSNIKLNRGSTAAIVMNCNPMTLGHLYLIEKVANQHDNLLVFLVEENLSVFPFDVRMKIVKKATKHLKNVIVLPSTSYIISKATFPTYFLKEINQATQIYMNLDLSIFLHYFMNIFSIDFRYVGTEPLDPLTNLYNQAMKAILKDKVIEIERLKKDDLTLSASYVRKLASDKKFDEIKTLVPKSTYLFLKSRKGRKLIS